MKEYLYWPHRRWWQYIWEASNEGQERGFKITGAVSGLRNNTIRGLHGNTWQKH